MAHRNISASFSHSSAASTHPERTCIFLESAAIDSIRASSFWDTASSLFRSLCFLLTGAFFYLPALLILFAGVAALAASLVFLVFVDLLAIIPKATIVKKQKEQRCITRAGKIQSEEKTTAPQSCCDQRVKTCEKWLKPATVTWPPFSKFQSLTFSQMIANLTISNRMVALNWDGNKVVIFLECHSDCIFHFQS